MAHSSVVRRWPCLTSEPKRQFWCQEGETRTCFYKALPLGLYILW